MSDEVTVRKSVYHIMWTMSPLDWDLWQVTDLHIWKRACRKSYAYNIDFLGWGKEEMRHAP